MNKLIKILMTVFLTLLAIFSIIGKTKAVSSSIIDNDKKASLTITKYEHTNGSEENSPLKGVEFTIYEIPKNANIETVNQAENYIKNNSVNSYVKVTPESGTITFSNLNLGRYLVVETDAPKSVLTKIDSFLIDLPRTKADGNGWDYDVTVYPKNVTVAGSVTLKHITEEGKALKETTWYLQKKSSNGEWKDYEDVGILTTNNDGIISVNNLEKGDYRFVQNSVPDGYIVDKKNSVNFKIDLDNLNQSLEFKSEKLEINQYVKTGDGEYTKELGVSTTDILKWRTIADVPEDISNLRYYKITEKIPENMNIDTSSVYAYGQREDGELAFIYSNVVSKNIQNDKINFSFVTTELSNYKKIVIDYITTFDYDKVKFGEFATSASLEFTDFVELNGESKSTYITDENKSTVYTGMVKILKTDTQGNALKGAKFKLATSEENAKNGVFIKDNNNKEIEISSDENGYAVFGGIKYGEYGEKMSQASTSYWIVETKTPSEKYNLLKKPEEVVVDKNNSANIKNIVNTEKLTLPLTGGKYSFVPMVIGVLFIVSAIILKNKNKGKKCFEEK